MGCTTNRITAPPTSTVMNGLAITLMVSGIRRLTVLYNHPRNAPAIRAPMMPPRPGAMLGMFCRLGAIRSIPAKAPMAGGPPYSRAAFIPTRMCMNARKVPPRTWRTARTGTPATVVWSVIQPIRTKKLVRPMMRPLPMMAGNNGRKMLAIRLRKLRTPPGLVSAPASDGFTLACGALPPPDRSSAATAAVTRSARPGPKMICSWLPVRTTPLTPLIFLRRFWSTDSTSARSSRSRVMQCSAARTFARPTTSSMVCAMARSSATRTHPLTGWSPDPARWPGGALDRMYIPP